ncbi:TetR/AcrR family transcriptional regulator [Ornithinimicrobium faecis]|uniref:TetR/AcrR family transcriptional regulator n=1 Tax=Ornithinimicrobium faecis TaxID=2934158 RepID=A0ABY4YV80_9MICO|nr:TetR/AcrR family transcriptional regulator [Ornithinimicrobium sp. HY1793]USQ80507.1 TetR/AcrR family transcriptional regulator [Ornithinimicrobium sp. HY1793]
MTILNEEDEAGQTPAPASTRQWGKTNDTRRTILSAAEDVFVDLGYWQSNISDIVERSGSSVGSIYHHFGGKAELFTALWENYSQTMGGVANEASQAHLTEHPDDLPIDAFCAGARAYCLHTWGSRRGLSLFYSGDTPPGYEKLRRKGNSRWLRRNAKLLDLGDNRGDALVTMSLTAVIAEACRVIIEVDTEEEARRVTEVAVGLLKGLYDARP